MTTFAPVTVIGSPVSPYVRKVLAACALKGVEVALDPITPFMGDDDFTAISPLRRVPVWVEGDLTLCDSSVILQYIEETRPGPSLWPADPVDRAKARWLEEYADTRVFDVLGWKLFYPLVLKPRFFGGEADMEAVARVRETELPEVLDYLESVSPATGFLFGDQPGAADFAVAAAFVNARAVRVRIDASRWPRLAALIDRIDAETVLGPINQMSWAVLKTPLEQHRALLPDFGYRPADRNHLGKTPRRGPLTPA